MNIRTLAVTSITLCIIAGCNSRKSPEHPNILFIVADDLGYHDLGYTGSNYYETPNIDYIASSGMVFTNGYAACQVCSPSRASIMSGKFPARHGITDYIGAKTGEAWREAGRETILLPPGFGDHLPHEYVTLPEAMQDNGYKTFFAGKWHLGGKGSYPEDHGFDINQGGYEKGGPYSGGYFSPFNNPKMNDLPEERGMSLSMKLAKETVNFMKDNSETPFYAHLSFYAVHAPIQTSREKWDHYRDKAENAGYPETGFEMERRLPIRVVQDNPVYAGLVEQMDDAVGYVLDALKDLELDRNTIVIFTSDNGGVSSGDNFSTSNLPLRGGKGYQWEGGLKEPYFIYVPWMNHQGAENNVPVTGTDFYPTILDLCGLELKPEEHIDGVSLLPLLKGEEIKERSLYWHYPHYGNQGGDPSSIIRQGDWKLIHYWEDNHVELYNLIEDPYEEHNLAKVESGRSLQMETQLMGWLDAMDAKFPMPDSTYNEVRSKKREMERGEKLLERLEKQRLDFLNADWSPNEDWWGSFITKD